MSPSLDVMIRLARSSDVPAVVAMAHELADYEKAPELCHLTVPQLTAALFAPRPAEAMSQWVPYRLTGRPLRELGAWAYADGT